jgi:hypothetical protein
LRSVPLRKRWPCLATLIEECVQCSHRAVVVIRHKQVLRRMARRNSLWWVGFCAFCFCLLESCGDPKPERAAGRIVYEFLANAQNAEVAHYHRERVNFAAEFTINKEKRPVLFEHPEADVRFDGVAIPSNSVLQFGIAISPEAWDKAGDGVTFEIAVIDQKAAKIQIFSSYINPKANAEERKWNEHDVDLKDYAGQNVSFILSTTYGPRGNGDYDWAGWSTPQIRLKTQGQ